MNELSILINVLEYILFIYFGIAAVYFLIYSFASIFPYRQKKPDKSKNKKIAVFIPGYKEDVVIYDVAKDATNQNYPEKDYDVIVIADSFLPETIDKLNTLPVRVLEVEFEVSTKAKALNKAMQVLGDNYEVALVLDADNLMNKDFLTKINQAFNNGFQVVQGHRVAKNQNTPYAILDAVSEEINNHIFRKGHRKLGLSSGLIGSGMAFDYALFKNIMAKIEAIGGFDKELELRLLRDRVKIEYIQDAFVLDEKVQKSEVFAKQRRRWLSAQFHYFREYFFSGLYHLFFKGNIDFFDKVYQMAWPPRILLLGIVGIVTIIYGLIHLIFPDFDSLAFSFKHWTLMLVIVVLAFLFAVPGKFYNEKTFKAVLTLPGAFLLMFSLLFKLKGANKKFIHTEHGHPNQENQ